MIHRKVEGSKDRYIERVYEEDSPIRQKIYRNELLETLEMVKRFRFHFGCAQDIFGAQDELFVAPVTLILEHPVDQLKLAIRGIREYIKGKWDNDIEKLVNEEKSRMGERGIKIDI